MAYKHLNVEEALEQLGGSLKLYKIIVEGFEDKYGTIDQEIRALSLAGDYKEAERLAHSIKGLSGNLGAQQLRDYARSLESIYRNHTFLKEEECLSQFGTELGEVVAEVAQFLMELKEVSVNEAAATREVDPLEGQIVMEQLYDALDSCQYGRINKAYKMFQTIQFLETQKDTVAIIEEAVETFNYAQAREGLKILL